MWTMFIKVLDRIMIMTNFNQKSWPNHVPAVAVIQEDKCYSSLLGLKGT